MLMEKHFQSGTEGVWIAYSVISNGKRSNNMGILISFAFLSGIITILSPCIFPLLPIMLSGGVGGGKTRSAGIVSGFIISFTFFTLTLTSIVQLIGIPPESLLIAAVVIIILFGMTMILPPLHEWFARITSRIANLGRTKKQTKSAGTEQNKSLKGFLGGLPVGVSLGLVWTPCVGPIMASVISLALTERVDSGAVFITLAYAIGTSIPMLAIMLGGNSLMRHVPFLTRNTDKIQKIFGVLMIVVGISIGFGWDRDLQAGILNLFPDYGKGILAIENTALVMEALDKKEASTGEKTGKIKTFSYASIPMDGRTKDYGEAPPFVTSGEWFNVGDSGLGGPPSLSMEELRGRVVLVDFWTYSCINCIRSIRYLKNWYDAYRDTGFVIIGVHTPEFEFEKNPSNVKKAVKDLGITWSVVLDNDYEQWKAYSNRYWPAHYFIDTKGHIRYFHFGEGSYDAQEGVIRVLLKEAGKNPGQDLSMPDPKLTSKTPETYLGYGRTRGFTSDISPVKDTAADYRPVKIPSNSEWNLSGRWTMTREYIVPETEGILQLGFHAKAVFLVIEPEEPGGRIVVKVDGKPAQNTEDIAGGILRPVESRLYKIAGFQEPEPHILQLNVGGRLRLFAFTFG
jgi:cytochrome c biogenesis protein CcdA/thiol-disulfide isomerase/thioredoxin